MKIFFEFCMMGIKSEKGTTFIVPFHDWHDWWIGLYRNTNTGVNYFCILPTLGFKIWFEEKIIISSFSSSRQQILDSMTLLISYINEGIIQGFISLEEPMRNIFKSFEDFATAMKDIHVK